MGDDTGRIAARLKRARFGVKMMKLTEVRVL